MNKQEKIAEILVITDPVKGTVAVMRHSFEKLLADEPGGMEAFDEAVQDNCGFLEDKMAAAYELFYTEEEINALHVFHCSKAGRSMAQKARNVGTALFSVGEEWGEKVANQVSKKIGLPE